MTTTSHAQTFPSVEEARRFVDATDFLWHQRFELVPGVSTPGVSSVIDLAHLADLPDDLSGRHVLDVGTTNGGTAIECERRGASRVVAVDVVGEQVYGIRQVLEFLGSEVEFLHASVYELAGMLHEQFDLVVFWGVLYHLRHPLLALDALRVLTAGTLSVETAVADAELGAHGDASVARFYRTDELGADSSNWFAPTVQALDEWLRSAGFVPERVVSWPDGAPSRAVVTATVADGVPEYLQLSYERPLRVETGADLLVPPATSALTVSRPTLSPRARPTPASSERRKPMTVTTGGFASAPAARPSLEECTFYHCIDLPEVGPQLGQWDLRAGIEQYLGDFDFAGARALEIGTANGFVCFEMERRGADVTAFDLAEDLTYDMFPGVTEERDPEGFLQGLRQTRNAYWLAHDLLGSTARVVYGHANHLPAFLDDFDVVVYANVLQHLQDPVGAVMEGAQRADAVIVTETDWKRGIADDLPAMLWLDSSSPYSWYQVKPLLVAEVLRSLGFEVEPPVWHEQLLLEDVAYRAGHAPEARAWSSGIRVPHFTVIGRRPESRR
jgi:2-polyprenyl-3-methyl-5-hydroxy-6-metoxy-1,4-benzoquinol methylase